MILLKIQLSHLNYYNLMYLMLQLEKKLNTNKIFRTAIICHFNMKLSKTFHFNVLYKFIYNLYVCFKIILSLKILF